MEGDDRTFRASFTTEGVASLRERVKLKLREFMGDYTDDTLVEYVIVLLKNGRRKDEARSELNVFLGDDSDAFVAWLWDHLGSNLSLYVQPLDPLQDDAPKAKSVAVEPVGRTELRKIEFETPGDPVQSTENSRKAFGNHHKRKWKDSVRGVDENDVSLPESSIADDLDPQDNPHKRTGTTKRLLSPRRTIQKKRRQPEEQQPRKREVSLTTVSAPRRLLQFAVRDALAISRPSNTSTEPSLKRLRSVVSTSTSDSYLGERSQRILPVSGLRTAMSAVVKAVAEAGKDVSKVRSSSKVFDRLGHATGVFNTIYQQEDYRVVEDGSGLDHINGIKDTHLPFCLQTDSNKQQDPDLSSSHDDPVMASDMGFVGQGYEGVDGIGRGAKDIFHSHPSGVNSGEDSINFQSGKVDISGERVRRPRQDLDQPAAAHNASLRISSSVDMKTPKTPRYQEVREVFEIKDHKLIQDNDTMLTKTEEGLLKNNNSVVAVNGNAKPEMRRQHEPQKILTPTGLYSTGPPVEDADSRTIFVSNVHFAATKDSLSRHFNKFGEVLKVIILTDPATSQPKGSAYIEFMRKEAAEHALSMDGTSFMSRILKIIKKSSAQPEAPSAMAWPRAARASHSFSVPRFGRTPFARGGLSLYRGGRTPIKPGGRSFQWKRESQLTGSEPSDQASNIIVQPPTARNLTYVRTEPKAEG